MCQFQKLRHILVYLQNCKKFKINQIDQDIQHTQLVVF